MNVFKYAIVTNAAHVIIFHNHIRGNCTPSSEDIVITKRLIEAGNLIGIPVLNHIIVGDEFSFLSLMEEKVVSFDNKPQIYMK